MGEGYGSSNVTRLTANNYVDTTPDLDRGSRRAAFISDRDGNGEVYRMNADGSGVTRLTYTAANEYLPTWSPDGRRIAFYSYRDGNAEFYVMNADGSNQTRLTFNTAWDGHPTWSPDGQQLAFVSQRTGSYEIFKMSVTGGNAIQLTSGATYAAYPDWSPDGSTILFNYDAPPLNDFYDVAKVSAAGGAHMLVIQSPVNADHLAPKWDPTGKYYAYSWIYWTLINNQWYWSCAYIITRDITQGADLWTLTYSGDDLYADWKTTDSVAPASQVNTLPSWTGNNSFEVSWYGMDPAPSSEMASYDVQVRDGNGSWIDWQAQTTQISANYTGQYGHTCYFRSRARDYANNLEAYPGGNGDTWTTVYQYSLTGQVLGNREQPVTVASITTNPSAINAGVSRHDGLFDLYFAVGGTHTLITTRNSFGALPPMLNVTIPTSSTLPVFYLPPLNDQISNSHFESGALATWNPTGDLTPTIITTAHTGHYAALLGGTVPSTLSTGPYLSAIKQTITVPLTLTDGTLSLLYKVESADPISDTLKAYVLGASETLTYTLPLTATGWTHQWFDVSAWSEPTATVQIELTTPDKDRPVAILIDEVTWGSSIIGSHPIYLPMMRR